MWESLIDAHKALWRDGWKLDGPYLAFKQLGTSPVRIWCKLEKTATGFWPVETDAETESVLDLVASGGIVGAP